MLSRCYEQYEHTQKIATNNLVILSDKTPGK